MTAALRVDLILKMTAGNAQLLQLLHGPGGAHRFTETGIDIDHRRQIGNPGDLAPALGHLR